MISFRIHKLSQHMSHHLSRAWRAWHWKEPCFILSPLRPSTPLPPHKQWGPFPVISCPGVISFPSQYLISNLRFLSFLKADKQTMGGDSIWGSKDFQVPDYFNFADVLDEWAYKEKVRRYFSWKKVLILVSDQKTISTLNVHLFPVFFLPFDMRTPSFLALIWKKWTYSLFVRMGFLLLIAIYYLFIYLFTYLFTRVYKE